jgi:lipopolysaccharide/colanic/teichoic acid biosynthesis glycosyltransferase
VAAIRGLSRLDAVVILGDLAVLLGTYTLLVLALEQINSDPLRVGLWCVGLVLAWLLTDTRQAYRRRVLVHPLESAYVAAKSTIVTGAVFYLLPLIGGPTHSRISNISVVVVLALAVGSWRLALPKILPPPPEELVIVGAGWAGQVLADALVARPHLNVRIVAFVDGDPASWGPAIHGIPVRPVCELTGLVHRPTGLARVVLANASHAHAAVFEQLTELAQAGVEVVQMSSLYEEVTGCVPVQHLGSYWWAVLPRPTTDVLYWFTKRALDIASSLIGLLVLAVLLPVLWPILCYQTGGSLFFSQVRVGKNGQRFTLYKLRTLPVASITQTDWRRRKAGNRPSRLCALIRAIGLDELPQLINILRGEMSLVGPRPYVPEEVEELEREIPFFRSRWMVRPGVTGWAQVNFGYGFSLADEVEKLQHDLYYIGHQSTYLDLLILLRTIVNAIRGRRPASKLSLSARPRGSVLAPSGTEPPEGERAAALKQPSANGD